jgi:hypothetical protein
MQSSAPSQEKAYKLTPAMLDALQLAADSPGEPVEIKLPQTAQALADRGFIVRAHDGQHETWGKGYYITPKGRTALKIYRGEG